MATTPCCGHGWRPRRRAWPTSGCASSSPPGSPGPEGSAQKLTFARLNQEISGVELELSGQAGLSYEDWTMRRPVGVDLLGRSAGFRYLRAKGNSIEGGTSEILRNIIAERVLGLPAEPRVDVDVPWKDLPR